MINIGDTVGFTLSNPPVPGDPRGAGATSIGLSGLATATATVIGVRSISGQNQALHLIVSTQYGNFTIFNITQDDTQSTPETWFNFQNTTQQPALNSKRVAYFLPGNGTTVSTVGIVVTPNGTVSHPTIVTNSSRNSIRRTRYASATTANAIGGILSAHEVCFRGTSRGLGGFFFSIRFSMNTNVAGSRAFVGLSASTTSCVASEPSSIANSIGVGFDAVDSSNGSWSIIKRDNATGRKITITDMIRNINDLYELNISSVPNGDGVLIELKNLSNNTLLYSNFETVNVPQNNALLRIHAACGPAASAISTQFELSQFYLETPL